MTTHDDMNAAFRSAARAGKLRFDDQGKLVPTEWIESDEPDPDDQTGHITGGSGDGGKGNEQFEGSLSPRRRDPDMTELIRQQARGY